MKEDNYIREYYTRDAPEFWYAKKGLLRPDELAAVSYMHNRGFFGPLPGNERDPGVIYSIGCGEGNLEKHLEEMGYTVYGVDPAPGAKELYKGKIRLDEYPGGGDTIVFCESIEHLFKEQFDVIWAKIPSGAWVVIVNWPDYHPIEPDGTGYDHVRRIDDEFFDELTKEHKVIFRRQSHLVLIK